LSITDDDFIDDVIGDVIDDVVWSRNRLYILLLCTNQQEVVCTIRLMSQRNTNLLQVETLQLNCPCHRSAAFASDSMLHRTQRGQPKQQTGEEFPQLQAHDTEVNILHSNLIFCKYLDYNTSRCLSSEMFHYL